MCFSCFFCILFVWYVSRAVCELQTGDGGVSVYVRQVCGTLICWLNSRPVKLWKPQTLWQINSKETQMICSRGILVSPRYDCGWITTKKKKIIHTWNGRRFYVGKLPKLWEENQKLGRSFDFRLTVDCQIRFYFILLFVSEVLLLAGVWLWHGLKSWNDTRTRTRTRTPITASSSCIHTIFRK